MKPTKKQLSATDKVEQDALDQLALKCQKAIKKGDKVAIDRTFEQICNMLQSHTCGMSQRYNAPGYTADDFKQFCRIAYWEVVPIYKPKKGRYSSLAITASYNCIYTVIRCETLTRSGQGRTATVSLSSIKDINNDGGFLSPSYFSALACYDAPYIEPPTDPMLITRENEVFYEKVIGILSPAEREVFRQLPQYLADQHSSYLSITARLIRTGFIRPEATAKQQEDYVDNAIQRIRNKLRGLSVA